MNRSKLAYLKAVFAELPPENSPRLPRQHAHQQIPGTPNPSHPTPTHPSPFISPTVPGTSRMPNVRVDTSTNNQRAIMNKIWYHQYTLERIIFLQNKAGPAKYYYHLPDHESSTCYKICTAIHSKDIGSPTLDPSQRLQQPLL